jgi:hypothetical protein
VGAPAENGQVAPYLNRDGILIRRAVGERGIEFRNSFDLIGEDKVGKEGARTGVKGLPMVGRADPHVISPGWFRCPKRRQIPHD